MVVPHLNKAEQGKGKVYLAEIGCLALEFKCVRSGRFTASHLTKLTHNTKYAKVITTLYDAFFGLETMNGLFPDSISSSPREGALTPAVAHVRRGDEEGVQRGRGDGRVLRVPVEELRAERQHGHGGWCDCVIVLTRCSASRSGSTRCCRAWTSGCCVPATTAATPTSAH